MSRLLKKMAQGDAGGDAGGSMSGAGGSSDRSYDITHKKHPSTGAKLLSPPRGPWDRRRRRKTAAFEAGVKTAASRMPLSTKEREMFKQKHGGHIECSLGKDKNGFYVYTHRARSKSYPTPMAIPIKDVKFIGSTG